jgi:signal transduction histidine kinase
MPQRALRRLQAERHRRSVGAFVVLAVALPLGCLFGALHAERVNAQVVALYRFSEDAARVLQLAVDEETGVRGFIESGDPLFLEPYRAARRELPGAIASLRRSAGEDPRTDTARRASDFIDAHRLWETDIAGYLVAHPSAPNRTQLETRGKALMDRQRRDVAMLTQDTTRKADALSSSLHDSALFAFIAAGAWILIVAAAFILFQRRADERERVLVSSLLERQAAANRLTHWRARVVAMLEHDFRKQLEVIAPSSDATTAGAVHCLHEMTDEILVFAQAAEDRLVLRETAFDLGDVVAEICRAHPARLIHAVAESADLAVHGDRQLISRALRHVVANAVTFSPGDALVTVRLWHASPYVHVSVSDPGRGIPPEDLPHLFDEWWRAKTAHGGRGTALGLFIAKKIADAHGGTVQVASHPDEGTTIELALPAASTDPRAIA